METDKVAGEIYRSPCTKSDQEFEPPEVNGSNDDEGDVYSLSDEQKQMLDLEEDTIEAIRDVFRSLDEDSSGYLDVSELETAMKSMGVECSKQEVNTLVNQIDTDGNGFVDLFEFARMVSEKLKEYDPEKDLREAFAVFDKDGDGRVGMDEIQSVVESLGGKMTREEIQSMLQEADENNDGYIDYGEFVKIWLGSGEKTISRNNSTTASDSENKDNLSNLGVTESDPTA